MPAHETYWTLEMVRALPEDGKRYEVLDGTLLVSPAPAYRHQKAVGLLYEILAPYTRNTGIGETLLSPAAVIICISRCCLAGERSRRSTGGARSGSKTA